MAQVARSREAAALARARIPDTPALVLPASRQQQQQGQGQQGKGQAGRAAGRAQVAQEDVVELLSSDEGEEPLVRAVRCGAMS